MAGIGSKVTIESVSKKIAKLTEQEKNLVKKIESVRAQLKEQNLIRNELLAQKISSRIENIDSEKLDKILDAYIKAEGNGVEVEAKADNLKVEEKKKENVSPTPEVKKPQDGNTPSNNSSQPGAYNTPQSGPSPVGAPSAAPTQNGYINKEANSSFGQPAGSYNRNDDEETRQPAGWN